MPETPDSADAQPTAKDDSALVLAGHGGAYTCNPATGAITRVAATEPGVISNKAEGAPLGLAAHD